MILLKFLISKRFNQKSTFQELLLLWEAWKSSASSNKFELVEHYPYSLWHWHREYRAFSRLLTDGTRFVDGTDYWRYLPCNGCFARMGISFSTTFLFTQCDHIRNYLLAIDSFDIRLGCLTKGYRDNKSH